MTVEQFLSQPDPCATLDEFRQAFGNEAANRASQKIWEATVRRSISQDPRAGDVAVEMLQGPYGCPLNRDEWIKLLDTRPVGHVRIF